MKQIVFGIFLITFFSLFLMGCEKNEITWESVTDETSLTDDTKESKPEEIYSADEATNKNSSDHSAEENSQDTETIMVYVCGAVHAPGVYELPVDARVVQAIEAAGGMTEEGDSLSVNQAKRLEDGEQIRIYTKEEVALSQTNGGAQSADGKVNINRADETALMTLPGIGAAKAAAIVEYRKSNGDFKTIEELMKIAGIKEAVFSQIKDKIAVS